jgi:hypothetical protein
MPTETTSVTHSRATHNAGFGVDMTVGQTGNNPDDHFADAGNMIAVLPNVVRWSPVAPASACFCGKNAAKSYFAGRSLVAKGKETSQKVGKHRKR